MSQNALKVSTWGNSLGIRLPKKIINELNISDGTMLDVKVVDNQIILDPKDEIDKLFSNFDFEEFYKNNKLEEIDFGEPVGNEMF
ncbi:AbrB/MazE/SpoVT family DNA-binding domain-containing protein [Ligilactobacillus agilis]|uniref:AbrB/MazE/SpoVT family DNA-binding domain-containing protein n=1 Tax=Ligilactobacillus agilis TaxID=1601 RepID=UPI0025A4A160|nr:AbrB/MazE/SpoVT family DNA-binding domain-containing protein [Ligilactobacillus agilis]MDM8279120.1 AbrB/MazE/SpoVT family DNA-binding domain-containing protein [Ligilactobacillus agilis]